MSRMRSLNLLAVVSLATCLSFFSCKKENTTPIPDKIPYDHDDASAMGYCVGTKWNRTHLTWYVEKWCNTLSESETRDILITAFQKWSNVSALEFTEVSQIGQADIVISFGDNHHWTNVTNSWCPENFNVQTQNTGILAHAYFPPPGSLAGDLHFCDLHKWAPYGAEDLSSISMLSVAIHEIGHTIGIAHSDDVNAIMYAYYRPANIKYELSQDDINAVQALYGTGSGNASSSISINGNLPSNVQVGNHQDFVLTIENTGTTSVTITNYTINNNPINNYIGAFSLVNSQPNFPTTLLPGETHPVAIRFTPPYGGVATANFVVTSTASSGSGSFFMACNGTALPPTFYPYPDINTWSYATNTITNFCSVARVNDFKCRLTEINVSGGYFKVEIINDDPNYSYQYATAEVHDVTDCANALAQGTQYSNQSLILTVYTNFQTSYGYLDLCIPVNVRELDGSLTRHNAGLPSINWY